MIEFLDLEIENFMCYSYGRVDFTKFNSALILGRRSNDFRISNGTGKSTIFKALNYVLFDEYPCSNINKIIRDGQQIAIVSVKIKSDNKYYKITRKRSLKSNSSELLIKASDDDVNWVSADCKTTKQTKEFLNTIIKISFTSWKNSVFFSQSGIKGLADATPSERKILLKEPLNLSIYSKFEKSAKKRLDLSQQDLDAKLKFVAQKSSLLEKQNSNSIELEDIKSSLNSLEEALQLLSFEKEKLLSEVNSLTSENKYKSLFVSKQKEINSLNLLLTKTNDFINDCNNKILQNKKSKQALDLKPYENIINNYKEEIIDDSKIEEFDNAIIKANNLISKLKLDIEKYSKPLPSGSECDSCHQELTDEYRNKISDTHNSLLEKSKSDLSKYLDKLFKIKENKTKLIKKIKDLQESKNNFNIAKSKYDSIISQQLIFDKNINDLNDKLSIYLKENKEYKDKLEILQKEFEDISSLFNKEEEAKKLLDIPNNKLKIVQQTILENENKIKSYIQRIGYLTSSNDTISEQLSSISLIDVEIEKLKLLNNVNKNLVKAFSNNGIPSLIINTILDDLQIESNILLKKIRPELEINFIIEKEDKDTLDMSFLVNGQPREFEVLSGGQRVFVAFALQLGLAIVIQKRLGVEINLLLLDEVDQPFDGEGKEAFVNMVKILQKEFKILVITHNERIKDKFDNVIVVDQENDVSTLKVL